MASVTLSWHKLVNSKRTSFLGTHKIETGGLKRWKSDKGSRIKAFILLASFLYYSWFYIFLTCFRLARVLLLYPKLPRGLF